MLDSLELSVVLPIEPAALLQAWLSSEAHSEFTGGAAQIDAVEGGRFTAWDGYIEGVTECIEPARLVQRWRTSEFPAESADSRLELRFEAEGTGTRLVISHTEIPVGQGERYRGGWQEFYFTPLQRWLASR